MDTRGLVAAQAQGVVLDSTMETAVGLPSVPSAIKNVYVKAKHSVGGGRVRTTLYFGDISDPNLANLAITDKRRNGLKPLPITITQGSGGGYGPVQLLAWPK